MIQLDNQHQKISGYRDFTQGTVDLINRIKAKEKELADLYKEVEASPDIDQRSLHLARNNLQTGFMWFVRSVAKPADVFE